MEQINFYPRPPRGGRRVSTETPKPAKKISIHALREEGDLRSAHLRTDEHHFYPRPPRGGRPKRWSTTGGSSFISIHALREEGDTSPGSAQRSSPFDFYPRPPRGGRLPWLRPGQSHHISIHALREEGDGQSDGTPLLGGLFLSTPSARRATPGRDHRRRWSGHFYPRPPRGGRRIGFCTRRCRSSFLSTPSARRATASNIGHVFSVNISIHALREEGDPDRP